MKEGKTISRFPKYPLSVVADLLEETPQSPVVWNGCSKQQIEVEGKVAAFENGRIRIYTELLDGTLGLRLGDKVKLIIVKED